MNAEVLTKDVGAETARMRKKEADFLAKGRKCSSPSTSVPYFITFPSPPKNSSFVFLEQVPKPELICLILISNRSSPRWSGSSGLKIYFSKFSLYLQATFFPSDSLVTHTQTCPFYKKGFTVCMAQGRHEDR
jgi:hypothetical protein